MIYELCEQAEHSGEGLEALLGNLAIQVAQHGYFQLFGCGHERLHV